MGVFWGTWGAALPALRTQAGLTEGQLGRSLLFVGVGALPAMFLTGRLTDRLGLRLTAVLLGLLGASGVVVALAAQGFAWVVAGMLLVGATSGATDVAINTLAGQVEHRTARPLVTRAHGTFSLAVVGSSLSAGALLGGPGLTGTFTVALLAILLFSALVWRGTSFTGVTPGPAPRPSSSPGLTAPLLALGLIGALAYATENAHQSWGAVFITESFAASPQLAATAPATFAAAAALARLILAPLSRSHPVQLLIAGGAAATVGTVVLATAPNVPVALLGLAVAALGTATLFPTLISYGLRTVDPARRGRATSAVATTAYLGFLLGPGYVGLLADASGLRTALLGIAALALIFTALAAPASRWAGARPGAAP
ncbi:MFS transporter [Kineosporia sp. NBRC 101677]|nr:MFS transporter [Kineosporia sp. NBRC 101677]